MKRIVTSIQEAALDAQACLMDAQAALGRGEDPGPAIVAARRCLIRVTAGCSRLYRPDREAA